MKEAIHTMKSAFVQLSSGDAHVPARLSLDLPDKNATSLIMPAYAIGSGALIMILRSCNTTQLHFDYDKLSLAWRLAGSVGAIKNNRAHDLKAMPLLYAIPAFVSIQVHRTKHLC